MKPILLFNTWRDEHSASVAAEKTMTVGELREFLEYYDDDLPVILSFDGGYTYGMVKDARFEETEIGDDD